MKRLMTTLLFVLLGWTGLCFAEATVTGTVQCVPSDGGAPNAIGLTGTVTLWQDDAATAHSAEVSGGTYSISNVPAGTYTAKFVGSYQGKDCAGDNRLIIANDATNETCNITARITITAVTISGNITIENPDNAESPIAGGVQSGTVSLWQNGEKKHEGNVTTEDNVSSYTLSAVPGSYTFAFDGVGNDNKVLFHKAYEFTVPTVNRPYDFMATVNTTGVAVSGAITHVDNDQTYGDIDDGTIQLLQGSEVKAETTVEKTGNTAYYAFSNVEAGTYTLSFIGTWHNQLVVKTVESVAVSTTNVTQDLQADIDDTRGYTTINVHYGENYRDYGGGYGSWETDIRLENATVTLTPTTGTPLVGTSDANGTVKFLVAKNADLTYTLKIEPQGEKYKDTTITSFVAYGDNGHGGNDFKTLDVYVQKIPLPTVKVSGKVTLNGELLKTLPVEDMAIGIKTVEGKNVRTSINYGLYTFESVPVDGDAPTTFYLYDPNPGAKEDRTLGDNVTYNFAISSPENGSVVLTESETGRTIDIEIKRIAVNITGTISGIKEQVSVYLKQGETTIANVSSNMVGDYKFQGVQPGTYTVVVDKYGYDQKNTPTVNVTSIEAGDVTAEAIVLEGKDIETTIACSGLYGHNKYTGSTVYLTGATATLWACEDGAATGEALQTVTAEGDYAAFSFTAFTTKFGTPYIVKVSHPDIEEAETMVNITSESTSVYFNSFVFKYDGPELLEAENFQYAWNAAKDTLILNWSWPEALKDTAIYKIQSIGLARKQSSEQGIGTPIAYWYAQDPAPCILDLPTSYKDTLTDGIEYVYTFEISYTKPYSDRINPTFTVDLRKRHTLAYGVNDPAMGNIEIEIENESANEAGQYLKNTHITLIAKANDGYKFVEWQRSWSLEADAPIDPAYTTSLDTLSFYMPGQDIRQTAIFKKNRFVVTLNANPENAGTVSGGGTYEGDTTVTIKAVANNGYQFKAWMEGEQEVTTRAEYKFKPEDDRSLTAVFEEVKYVLGLGVNHAEWGKVEGAGEFKAGTEVTAKAIANEGYKFVAWTEGEEEVSTEANYTFKLEKDRTLTAVFEDATTYYTVTLEANNAEWGKVEGGDKYAAGSNATVKATANKDYHFVAWMEGETKVSEEAVYTFKVEKDITLTAVFAEGAANEELEAALWTIYAENGTIVIKGLSGDRYSVYDLNGRLAGQALCTGAEIRMDVAPNKLYIVRRVSAAGLFGAKKIVVR